VDIVTQQRGTAVSQKRDSAFFSKSFNPKLETQFGTSHIVETQLDEEGAQRPKEKHAAGESGGHALSHKESAGNGRVSFSISQLSSPCPSSQLLQDSITKQIMPPCCSSPVTKMLIRGNPLVYCMMMNKLAMYCSL
jgi:hypothetical protein